MPPAAPLGWCWTLVTVWPMWCPSTRALPSHTPSCVWTSPAETSPDTSACCCARKATTSTHQLSSRWCAPSKRWGRPLHKHCCSGLKKCLIWCFSCCSESLLPLPEPSEGWDSGNGEGSICPSWWKHFKCKSGRVCDGPEGCSKGGSEIIHPVVRSDRPDSVPQSCCSDPTWSETRARESTRSWPTPSRSLTWTCGARSFPPSYYAAGQHWSKVSECCHYGWVNKHGSTCTLRLHNMIKFTDPLLAFEQRHCETEFLLDCCLIHWLCGSSQGLERGY